MNFQVNFLSDIVLLEKEKVDTENLKKLPKMALITKNEKNKNTIDKNNLMIMIFKLSSLDLTDILDTIRISEENFPDMNLIHEVISKSSTSNTSLKTIKLPRIIDIIFTEVYFS